MSLKELSKLRVCRMTSEFWYIIFWTGWIILFRFLIINPLITTALQVAQTFQGLCK